jgi:restriction system protein
MFASRRASVSLKSGSHVSAELVALRNLDLTDLTLPLGEVRSYLAAKYSDRFSAAPRLFEDVVASVFRDCGYRTRVTGRSGDDGIDVILDGDKGDTIGVQVKRYQSSIEMEQIRALAGALVLQGLTRGIFVTTSRFQSGAHSTVERFAARSIRIELFDAQRFYEALRIAQRKAFSATDFRRGPFDGCELEDMLFESGRIEE